MPMGTGTYGSKKGRPMKKKPTAMKKKYKGFSKLPEGVQKKINKKLSKKVLWQSHPHGNVKKVRILKVD